MKNKAAQELGRLGGQTTTEAKATAARTNGALGGRPARIQCDGKTVDVPQSVLAEITNIRPPLGGYGFISGDIRFEFRGENYTGHVSIPHETELDEQDKACRRACAFTLIRQGILA